MTYSSLLGQIGAREGTRVDRSLLNQALLSLISALLSATSS